MKKIQCSCGKYYDSDRKTCPYCGETKIGFTEENSSKPQEVPGILLFGVIMNLVLVNFLSIFIAIIGWRLILQIVYIAFAIFYLVRSCIWNGRYTSNHGVSVATNVISVIELVGGIIGLLMLISSI